MINLNKKIKKNRGMTYVELIVVLSIFAIMSAVSMFNYRGFQAKIDIKNLATDIAMQIVGAQKDAMAGRLPPTGSPSLNWKPAYGIHFDISNNVSNKRFIYFADLNDTKIYQEAFNSIVDCSGDPFCVDKINITKGNYVLSLQVVGSNSCNSTSKVDVVFKRPDSSAILSADGINCGTFSKVVISISSAAPDNLAKVNINLYQSGRIEITNVN